MDLIPSNRGSTAARSSLKFILLVIPVHVNVIFFIFVAALWKNQVTFFNSNNHFLAFFLVI